MIQKYSATLWILLIICFFLFHKSIIGKNYYVDKYASGSNNGNTWENAWNSFGLIEWTKLNAGDVLLISGGKDSTVYNETLMIEVSGSENNLFTIRKGLDPMHNGKVIIDVPNDGIRIIKKSYLKISNIEFKNVSHGVYIRGAKTGDVNVIYLDSLKVLNFTKQGAISINGWSSSGLDATVDSVFIRYCTLTTSYPTTHQTDVIYAQYCNNLFILNNTLTVTSKMKGPHTDGIQFVHNINNITIADNTIINLTNSDINNKCNGIMGANLIGKGLFFNNIIYAPNFKNSGNNVFSYSNGNVSDTAGAWYIFNNIFIGGGTINLFKIEDKDAHIKNNIFYSMPAGTGQVFLRSPLEDWSQLDYNLYGQNNGINEGKIIKFEGSKSMGQMQNLGAELHGIDRKNPLFKTPFSNLYLQNESPALNRGINLGIPFNIDKNGIERPQDGNWDIGCYQNSH
jgi:hypothetical protein